MRTAIVSLFVLLPGLASAQQGLQSYTPEPTTDTPTFINAEVVRVNRDNTATFRAESGETTLTVEESAIAALGSLKPGDKVLLGYRDVRTADGRTTRYVTAVRPVSGEPARAVPAKRATSAPTGPAGVVTTSLPATASPVATIISVQPVAPASTAPSSPFTQGVPGIPAPPRNQGAVLPPAAAKEPLSAEDVGSMQAQGERDLAAAAVALAAAANGIDTAWAGFKDQCLRGATTTPTVTTGREWYVLLDNRIPTPADDGCRAVHSDLTSRAQGFKAQLETVEDAARKADVLPARVREVLDRHKL